MLGLGLFLIVTGLCSFGMAAMLKMGDGGKGKKKKGKKKDELAQAPPPNPKGFYLGGVLFLLAGIGFVAAALMD